MAFKFIYKPIMSSVWVLRVFLGLADLVQSLGSPNTLLLDGDSVPAPVGLSAPAPANLEHLLQSNITLGFLIALVIALAALKFNLENMLAYKKT